MTRVFLLILLVLAWASFRPAQAHHEPTAQLMLTCDRLWPAHTGATYLDTLPFVACIRRDAPVWRRQHRPHPIPKPSVMPRRSG